MRRNLKLLVLLGIATMLTALHYAENVWATPAKKFVGTTLARGRFAEIDVIHHFISPTDKEEGRPSNVRLPAQKTEKISDVYVQNNVWKPGGSTGWHTHPGQSLIIVTQGTVTGYEADDPDCKPHVYTEGMGFVDPGGDHVHILRNEDPKVVAKTVAIQVIPRSAALRIDVADPGNCHF